MSRYKVTMTHGESGMIYSVIDTQAPEGCDLRGIDMPKSVGSWLDLRGCDLRGITLPQSIGGSLDLSGCDLRGITLPQSIGGSLYLSGCDLNGITLPHSIGGWLDLRGCTGMKVENAADFCRIWSLPIMDGVVILFKAVNHEFRSGRNGDYRPGTVPRAPDWDGGRDECGGGLHFCPSPRIAKTFAPGATRFVACPVKLDEIAIHENAKYPHKVKARGCCAPCWECDIDGKII